jgi:endonuclease YncB( thermonuclease family)
MKRARLPLAASLLALLAAPSSPGAREELAGPIPAEIVEVIDGDTVKLRAHIWLGQEVETAVRLAGINAPELRGDCDAERQLAQQARAYLTTLLTGGAVSLRDIAYDKYGGRVVAQVIDAAGRDLGAALVTAGYARPYDGGKRAAWC